MAAATKPSLRGRDRILYILGAAGFVLIVLTGFARTYYLKGLFDAPALSGLVHVHGLVMTLWVTLFVVQVTLISARRTKVHRRLGMAGGVLAGLVLLVGYITALSAVRRGIDVGMPPLQFLAEPLGDLLVFAIFVALGLSFRRKPDVHKRLILLSCVGFLPAAIARIPLDFIATGGPVAYLAATDLCLIACIAFDTIRHRRLHPVFGWGFLCIVLAQPFRLWFAGTEVWLRFAAWLVG